jgi:integrase
MRFRVLEACLQEIAELHGSETARQCRTVLGKYVIQQLQRDEAIPGNPLGGMSIDLRSAKPKPSGPRGGVALSRADWERVIEHLVALDPAGAMTMRQGRWSREDRVAKRRAAIDMSLVQAGTGLRQAECLALTWGDVETEDDGQVIVTVRPEVSKTKRGRRVPILHDAVIQRILERQNIARGRARVLVKRALVFGSPTDPSKPWDRTNAQATTTVLYKQMHEQRGIAAFETERSHVWRATLNSMLLDLPDLVRAAYFGHDVDVNRSAYTDLTDVSGMVAAARRLRAV